MEVTPGTGREAAGGLLEAILPPRLEDAGLEDCALPPDSIHRAFLKAASAVKSRAAAFFHSDDEDEDEDVDGRGCLDDPLPDNAKPSSDILDSPPCPDLSDAVVVVGDPASSSEDTVGGCVKEKGCGGEAVEGRDTVVVGGEGVEAADGKGCIDVDLKGLKIGEKGSKKKKKNEDEEELDQGKDKPILVEDFV